MSERRACAFASGFRIDFDDAPKRGLCARLNVWVRGHERPLRDYLFDPPPGACD